MLCHQLMMITRSSWRTFCRGRVAGRHILFGPPGIPRTSSTPEADPTIPRPRAEQMSQWMPCKGLNGAWIIGGCSRHPCLHSICSQPALVDMDNLLSPATRLSALQIPNHPFESLSGVGSVPPDRVVNLMVKALCLSVQAPSCLAL